MSSKRKRKKEIFFFIPVKRKIPVNIIHRFYIILCVPKKKVIRYYIDFFLLMKLALYFKYIVTVTLPMLNKSIKQSIIDLLHARIFRFSKRKNLLNNNRAEK
jgi:hypothetical protein